MEIYKYIFTLVTLKNIIVIYVHPRIPNYSLENERVHKLDPIQVIP